MENGVSKLARLFFIVPSTDLLITRTGIKSRTSSNSGRIVSVTTKLPALEGGLNFQ